MSTGLGERIRNRRIELGWSQEELAHNMGFKSKSTICKIERGEDNLTTTAVRKYAEALHTTPSYLMGWEDRIVDYVDGSYTVETATNNLDERTLKFLRNYSAASPEVQQAIDLLLKADQPDS